MIDREKLHDFLSHLMVSESIERVHSHLSQFMCQCLVLIKDYLPPVGEAALQSASDFWKQRSLESVDLESIRVACWRYLDAKHGDSTGIVDKEDAAMRALLCVLYESPLSEDFDEDSLLWFADMFDRIGDYSAKFEILLKHWLGKQ